MAAFDPAPGPSERRRPSYKAPDDLTYFRYDPATQSPLQRTDDNTVDSWDSGSYLVWQGKFFSNKLQTVAGVRYDRSDARTTLRDLTTGAVSSVVGSTTRPSERRQAERKTSGLDS